MWELYAIEKTALPMVLDISYCYYFTNTLFESRKNSMRQHGLYEYVFFTYFIDEESEIKFIDRVHIQWAHSSRFLSGMKMLNNFQRFTMKVPHVPLTTFLTVVHLLPLDPWTSPWSNNCKTSWTMSSRLLNILNIFFVYCKHQT